MVGGIVGGMLTFASRGFGDFYGDFSLSVKHVVVTVVSDKTQSIVVIEAGSISEDETNYRITG